MAKKVEDTLVVDTNKMDKKERRNYRIALRDRAREEALAKNLPFDDSISAIKFEQDYEKAFEAATTSEGAIPAERIREIQANIAKMSAKTSAQLTAEAAKATLLGSQETKPEEPVVEETKPEEPVVEETKPEEPVVEAIEAAIADPNLRREGESKKQWKQRIHRQNKAARELDKPTTKRYPTGELVYNSDEDGDSCKLPVTKTEEVKTEEVKTEEVKETNLKVVSSNNTPDRGIENTEGAKKFYSKAWNTERSAALSEAYYWLCRAIVAQEENSNAKFRMAMGSALKHEAAAFGRTITAIQAITEMEEEFDAFSCYHSNSAVKQARAA